MNARMVARRRSAGSEARCRPWHASAAPLVLALLCPLAALPSAAADDPPGASSAAAATPTSATAAAVGLLPVHGVLVDLDALPGVSGKKGEKDESLAALQRLWDSYLEGAGFNVIEIQVDVRDLGARGAERVARLCEWSRQNNVRVAPCLVGAPEGKPLPKDYGQLAASFVGKVIAALGPAGSPGVQSYAQIVFYQLDRPLNHPASHGPMEPADASALLKSAAESIRAAEQAGLAQSGLQPTPLLVPSSFDYELIRRGAIAHTPMTDESYGQAYEGLKDYLLAVLGAAPVEAAAIEWYPGSVSSEGVDRLPDLIDRLEADLPGKLLVMDTGYSSAAAGDTAQARYYALALNNLCDLRAKQGVDSPFAGILWRSAVDGGGADAAPSSAGAAANAGELNKMWTDPKSGSKEARSWWTGVQSRFGLLARAGGAGADGLAPKTAYRIMSGLEAALAQSPQASDALAAVKELGSGKGGGVGSQLKARLQSAMFGMLDAWLSKTADNLFTPASDPAPLSSGPATPLPDVQILTAPALPASVPIGAPVTVAVTLFNAGSAVANDVAVYLRDKQAVDLARTNPTSLSPGGTTTVELLWVPSRPGMVQGVNVEAFCAADADPTSNRAELNDTKVEAAGGGGGGRPPRGVRDFSDVLAPTRALDASPGTSGGSKGGATGGGAGGATTSGGSGGAAGGPRGTAAAAMVTSSAIGFASIDGLSAPQVMMAPAPGGGGSTSGSTTPTSTRAIAPPPPPAEPVSLSVVNPFNTAFRGVVATLRVDDAVVARRDLGTLMPGQRRTIAFTEWKPPKPGTYRLRADLDGYGTLGKKLTSSATSTVTISGSAPATPTAAAAAPAPAPTATRAFAASRTLTPLVRTVSSQPVPMLARPTRGLGGPPGVRSLAAGGTLALSANSILLRPFPPVAGQPLGVTVQLSNTDRTPVSGARVTVSVDGEALGEAVANVPASGAAVASGFKEWMARPGRHEVRATVTAGARRSEAVKLMFVNAAGTRGFGHPSGGLAGGLPGATGESGPPGLRPKQTGFKPGLGLGRPGTGPDLQLAATDIRFTPPTPAAGTAATVAITVHNLGTALASDGKVLAVLTAGGTEVTRKQFAAVVPARGVLVLEWPLTMPAATPIVVTATATATGDVNATNNQARATPTSKPPVKVLQPRTPGALTPH